MPKYLSPKNDLTFKKVFGKNKHLCMSLLNSLLPLPEPIVALEYGTTELLPLTPELKDTVVDVYCSDRRGRQFIVEMQLVWSEAFMTRIVLNASKVLVEQVGKGDDYTAFRPVYSLALVNANFRHDTKEYYHRYVIADEAKVEAQLKGMEFVFVELKKFKPKTMTERKMSVLWLRFMTEINEETKEVSPILLKNPNIKEAIGIMETSAYSKEELDAYWHNRVNVWAVKTKDESLIKKGEAIGLEKGETKGRAEGSADKARDIARKMLLRGEKVEIVAENTGLSVAEVEALLSYQ